MPNTHLTISDAGLDFIRAEEARVDGLYDDARGFCTYGIGVLVHRNRCFLLAEAAADSSWSAYVKKLWPNTKSETPYLDRTVRSHDDFEKLKEKAKQSAKAQSDSKVNLVDRESQMLAHQVETLFRAKVAEFERGVRSTIDGVSLTQDEFDALVSFSYNIGVAGFANSTAATKINEGQYKSGDVPTRKAAIAEIDKWIKAWNKSGGRVLRGLVKRREREANWFLREAREELKKLESKKPEAPSPQSTRTTAARGK